MLTGGVSLQQKRYRLDNDVPEGMRRAVVKYEDRFEVHLPDLTYFPRSLFNELHKPSNASSAISSNVTIASEGDSSILQDMEVLSEVANAATLDRAQREQYYATLLAIYGKLPRHPSALAEQTDTLCVGIEREGRMLAEALQCLPLGRSLRPHAKRVLYEGGLVVAMSEWPELEPFERCLLIDGAIASGATLMAAIEHLRSVTSSFYIFSAHSSIEGLRGLTRFAEAIGVDLLITVGHATSGLTPKYYAVVPDDPSRLIVGDLGDTIAVLE